MTDATYEKMRNDMKKLIKEKDEKQLEKVRKRVSYKYFKELLEFLNSKPSKVEILQKIHEVIDGYQGFHSQQNSIYALESLELLRKDERLEG